MWCKRVLKHVLNVCGFRQVAFHDLVLSLDGEGGWAVYRGKRAAERDGGGDDGSSYAEVAMSSSAPSETGGNFRSPFVKHRMEQQHDASR